MGGLISAKFLLVLVITLVVLGPEKLPEAARTMGRWLTEFRRVTSGFTEEVRQAFDASDLAEPVQELRSATQALRGTTAGWGGAARWIAASPGAPGASSSTVAGTDGSGAGGSGANAGSRVQTSAAAGAGQRTPAGGWTAPPEAELGIPPGDPSLN